MRIVIVGGGEIGFALAQPLSQQNDVFVVDHAPDVADRFEPLDVQFVLGAGTSRDVLARAGVARADVLVACTGLDEVNIVSCAVARQSGTPSTICFVSREASPPLASTASFGPKRSWRKIWSGSSARRARSMPRALRTAPFNSSSTGSTVSRHLQAGRLPTCTCRTALSSSQSGVVKCSSY